MAASRAETEQAARRVPELEKSVRQLEAALWAAEDQLHASGSQGAVACQASLAQQEKLDEDNRLLLVPVPPQMK